MGDPKHLHRFGNTDALINMCKQPKQPQPIWVGQRLERIDMMFHD